MSVWQRLWQQPQRVWLRRAMFQIHLWGGLAIGLYLVILSVTGSVLVYRNELDRWFATPRPAFDAEAARLTADELQAAAGRAYPGWTITLGNTRISRRNTTVVATVTRGNDTKERLFDPYTGADLGDVTTRGEFFVLWLVQLHDELLFDRPGRYWNGIGGAITTVVVFTGAFVWWPGVSRWKRSLGVKVSGGWRRLNWDLHSAMGFWLFFFMAMWGVSGFYLGVPAPFNDFVDWVSEPAADERPGDVVLMWLARLHFGRWRDNEPLKAAWALFGLAPAVMFVTGVVMWWSRVVRPKLRRRPSLTVEISETGTRAR